MAEIRSDERSQLRSAFENNTDHVHVYGEPGIGKSTLVEQTLDGPLASVADGRITVREMFTPELVEKEALEELRDLASTKDEAQSRTAGWSISIPLPGIGGGGGGRTLDERERDIHKLQSLSEGFEKRAILWMDDVQKIAEKQRTVRDCIAALSDALPESITLVTSGRTPLRCADTTIELQPLSAEETGVFLRSTFPDLPDETTKEIHEQVDGHPYSLELLVEAADSPEDLELPEGDVYSFIEDEYLDTLSRDEERFVRQTSPLTDLDESLCAAVVSDVDRTAVRQILTSLRHNAVIRVIDRNDTGERIYSMHDLLQRNLYNRLDNEEELHRRAFQYYVRDVIDSTTKPELAVLTNFGSGIFAQHHLQKIYDGEPAVEDVQTELDQLGLTIEERRLVLHWLVTYVFDSPESRAELMRAETTALMQRIKAEADVSQPHSVLIQLYLDALPSILETDTDSTPIINQEGYHDELMEEVRSFEWDDADPESIQFFEDLVSASIHGAALATATSAEDGNPEPHKQQLIAIIERYGLEAEIAREVHALTREFFEETLPGFDIESSLDTVLEDQVGDAFDSGSIRKNLQTLQDTMPNLLLSMLSAGLEKTLAESDDVFEYFSAVEQALSDAENPLFVAFWTRLCAQIYTVLGPNGERADYFEDRFERARERRIEYEQSLETPLLEIEADELLPDEQFANADSETDLEELVDFDS